MRKFHSVLELIKDSTIVQIEPRGEEQQQATLWGQLELQLPGGMKDRVGLQMIEDAERSGALRPGDVIIESSSGTMAEGLARVGALKGYRVIIVTDPRLDEITAAKLIALGAELEIVSNYDRVGGWQSSRLQRLFEVMARIPNCFWPRQYDSQSNPTAYSFLGKALFETLGPDIAAIVGAVGTGGSLCGIGQSLRRYVPTLKVVAVDAVGSVLFNQPNAKRFQSGHGNSLLPGNVNYRVIDEVHWIADGEAFNGCRELARRSGIFAGGSSGAAYVVGSWVAKQFSPDQHVITIFPDRGDRYYGSIYSDEFMSKNHLFDEVASFAPIPIRYGIDVATRWSCAVLPHDGHIAYAGSAPTTIQMAESLKMEAAAAQ